MYLTIRVVDCWKRKVNEDWLSW